MGLHPYQEIFRPIRGLAFYYSSNGAQYLRPILQGIGIFFKMKYSSMKESSNECIGNFPFESISIPHVFFIVFDFVLFKVMNQFFFKFEFFMMKFLVLDVFTNSIYSAGVNRESRISILPIEVF